MPIDHLVVCEAIRPLTDALPSQQRKTVSALQVAFILPTGSRGGKARLAALDTGEVLALGLALLLPPAPGHPSNRVESLLHLTNTRDKTRLADDLIAELLNGKVRSLRLGWFRADRPGWLGYAASMNQNLYGPPVTAPVFTQVQIGDAAIDVLADIVKLASE